MTTKGIKFLLIMFIFSISSFSYAGLVDAVSMIINNSPITLLEISNYSKKFHISPKKAVQLLIQEKLEDALIKKDNLTASNIEIDNEIEKISLNAGISANDFKKFLKNKDISLSIYRKDLAKKIEKQKLYKRIISGKIQRVGENKMKEFYTKNINLFSIPKAIEVVEYSSNDKKSLEQMIKNPMINFKNIIEKKSILKSKNLNPKLLYILQKTKENSFTPILTLNKNFMSFYVKKKIGVKSIPYEKVKSTIFTTIMDKREKEIIKSYFDKLISKAKIEVIREPR